MYYSLDTVTARPECRPALDTLERHGVPLPSEGWLVLEGDRASLGAGDPGGAGVVVTSGPYTLGSGAGLTASEAAAYVRGATRATVGATEGAEWSASLDGDGDWLAQLRSGGALRSWTIAAGAEPGLPVVVLV